MTRQTCDKCQGELFKLESQSINGGYTLERICAQCGDTVEIIDTYSDQEDY